MTVVAVKVSDDGGFCMAADSCMNYGSTELPADLAFNKMIKLSHVVIAAAGYSAECSLLQQHAASFFNTNRAPSEGLLLSFLSSFAKWKKETTGDEGLHPENSYFFGFRDGSVFYVHGWFISRIKSYHAIGCGMDHAFTAMDLFYDPRTAVHMAICRDVYCAGPVQVIESKTWEITTE